MLAYLANMILLAENPAATILEKVFNVPKKGSARRGKKKAPSTESAKVSLFDHFRRSSLLCRPFLWCRFSTREHRLRTFIKNTEKRVEKSLDIRSLIKLRLTVDAITKVLFSRQ